MRKKFKLGFIFLVLLSFVLTMIFGLTNPARNTYANWTGSGTGTESDPYQIGTKADLDKFRDIVNGTGEETKNLSVCGKLTADIDLNKEEWTPIGNTLSNEYQGTFDGNKKTIKGLAIKETNDSAGVGLFGRIYGATIKNLTVEGSVSGGTSVGGIVGYAHAYAPAFATITGCISNVTVTGVSRVGGVVGEASQCNVSNCRNIGNITGTGNDNVGGTGGIVGIIDNSTSNITVSNCFNTGKIVSVYQAGGIVGLNSSNASSHNWVITNCYNTGDIEASVGRAGGITGYNNGKVEKCHNVGKVITPNTGTRDAEYAGGIIGLFLDNDAYAPINCYYLEGCVQGKTEDRAGGRYKQLSDPILFEGNYLSASSFKDSASFSELDFVNTWKMGENYPILIANVEETEQLHEHGYTTYEKWSATDSLPTTAGNYYLANDVILSSTWNVPKGETNLCLNGHGIIGNGFSGMMIYAATAGARLVIDDCSNTEHKYSVADSDIYNGAGLATVNDNLTKNYLTFKGGYITGGNLNTNEDYAAITAKNDGVITINGGTIIGNKNTNGQGAVLYSSNCGVIKINGGSIIHNLCQQAAVYSCVVGTLSINGGVIAYNASVNQSIAGVSTDNSADLYMSGLPLIKNNYGPNNTGVDLRLVKPITFGAGFTPKGKIGINVGTANGKFTANWNEIMVEKDPYDYFYSQDSDKPYIGLKDGNLALFAEKQVARAGNNTYESLLAAYNACAENGTITLFEDIDLTQENVTINIANSITIDLNGKILKFAENQIVLSDSANLTIDNSKIKTGGINGIIPETASASVTFKNARTNCTKEEITTSSYLKLADEFVAVNINEDGSADTNGFKTIIRSSNSVAEVNGILYPSLKQAYEECEEDDTIILLADIDLTGKSIYFQIVKNITIDLNGHIFSTWDQSYDSIYIYKDNYVILKNSVSKSGGYKNGLEFSAKFSGSKNHSFIVLDNGVRTTYDVDLFNEDNEYFIVVDGFVAKYINSNKSADENGFKSIIGNPYTPLDPDGTPTVNKPNHDPLFEGDEISIETEATDVTFEWFYTDEDGNPTGDAIGTGLTYKVKSPNDLGKIIIAVVIQNKKSDGTDYADGEKPKQYSDPLDVYKPFDTNSENKPEIEIPNDKEKAEDGDYLIINVDATPVNIKWYYDDDHDGLPDSNNPIGEGKNYIVKCPNENDEHHNDKGHTIIGVITQDKKPDGSNYPTGEVPTFITKPITVSGKLPKTAIVEIGRFYLLGDTILFEEDSYVKINSEEDVLQKSGKVLVTYKLSVGLTVKFMDMFYDANNSYKTLYVFTISTITTAEEVAGLKCVSGDGTSENPYVFMAVKKEDIYTPLKPEEKVSVTVPGYPVFVGDELLNETKATEATTEWFYDDDKDGNHDSTTSLGTGEKYTVREEDLGHNIIAVMKQNKKDDGTDYAEGEKPTATSLPIKVYTPMGDEKEVAIATTDDKKYPEPDDEIRAEVGFTPSTIKWYYDDDKNGGPDTTTPIGEGSTYEVKDKDKGHNIIAIVTQDKKPDGTDYAEGEKPTITSSPVEIYKPLDTQTELDVIIPGNKNNPAAGDDIEVNPNSQPVTVKWYYDDDKDGIPDTTTPLGTGEKYTIKDEDKGHTIIGVITQDKKPDDSEYEDDKKPTTTTKPVQVYYPINPDEEVEVKTTNDKERPVNGDEITVDSMVTPVTVEWFYDDDQDGTPDSTTPIGTGTTYVVKAPDANDPTHDDTGHTIIGVITQNKKPDGTDYADGEKPTTTTTSIRVKGYLPGEYVPLDTTETPAPTVPNKKTLEDGDEITLETDATDVIIEWFYDDDEDGKPDTTTPIGTGATYTLKCPDQVDPTHDDRSHKIIAVVTQIYDENGDEYPEAEKPTQVSTTITNIKPLHEHSFKYTANGAVITAQCENEECFITEGLTLTLKAPTGDMVYDGKDRVATIESGYNADVFGSPVIKYYYGTRKLEVTECINAGDYTASVEVGNAVASVTFTIKNWAPKTDVTPTSEIKEKEPNLKVDVEIEGSGVEENISVKVEVKTTLTAQETGKNYDQIKTNLANDETITRVYEVRLIHTVNGVEQEIQPSDIKEGTSIIVSMTLPENITGQFKILHVHAPNDVEFITDFTIKDRIVSFKVSRLSEFAFIVKTDIKGFPGWATALIVIDSLLVLLAMAYLSIFFIFNKWIVVNGKAVRVLKCGKNNEKVRTITFILTIEYVDEAQVFNSEEEALAFINK